jgi:hypothetical protein
LAVLGTIYGAVHGARRSIHPAPKVQRAISPSSDRTSVGTALWVTAAGHLPAALPRSLPAAPSR